MSTAPQCVKLVEYFCRIFGLAVGCSSVLYLLIPLCKEVGYVPLIFVRILQGLAEVDSGFQCLVMLIAVIPGVFLFRELPTLLATVSGGFGHLRSSARGWQHWRCVVPTQASL